MRAEKFQKRRIVSGWRMWLVLALLLMSRVPMTEAETTIGGHIGFVLPLVTRAGSTTTNIADHFSIGFPLGVTFKGNGRMAYDLELVPGVQGNPIIVTGGNSRPWQTNLTVHPGFVWDVGHSFGVGLRGAFDINSSQWGFTPLVNHSGRSRTVFSRLILLRRSCQSVSTAQSLVP